MYMVSSTKITPTSSVYEFITFMVILSKIKHKIESKVLPYFSFSIHLLFFDARGLILVLDVIREKRWRTKGYTRTHFGSK